LGKIGIKIIELILISITQEIIIIFQEKILKWAEDNLEKYPWRENRTPYSIMISEILLTRTKAAQVIPVYLKFMEKYPNLEVFLEASYEKILKLIRTLGLLNRANKMMILIKYFKEYYDLKIPETFDTLKNLPGIGDYGAKAILCFGYNKREGLIDTNFIRIFSRFFNINSKTKTPKTDNFLWNFAKKIVPEKNFINYNYGVIDFANKVCSSKNPKCESCVLKELCYFSNKLG